MSEAAKLIITCPKCGHKFEAALFSTDMPVCPKCGYPEPDTTLSEEDQ